MTITKPRGRIASATHQQRDVDDWEMMKWVLLDDDETKWEPERRESMEGEVMHEITWRFFPPAITVPGFDNVRIDPEERESTPAVLPIRLLPRRGVLTPVRVAIWSVSLMLIAATAYLIWNIEPPGDTPAAMGVPGTFDTRADDEFADSCEDTTLMETATVPDPEIVAPKPKKKNPARQEQKSPTSDSKVQADAVSVKAPAAPMVEDNPY